MNKLLLAVLVALPSSPSGAVVMAPSTPVALPASPRALAAAQAKETEKKKSSDRDSLSHWVMKNALRVSRDIHRTGGYRFDGFNDCWGFVRRTWDPILHSLRAKHHVPGDYPSKIPVADYPSPSWHAIRDWNDLRPGDILGTNKGHRWGGDVHYGLYAGKRHGVHYQFDNGGGAGPKFQPNTGRFKYYYGPTHKLLEKMRP